MKRKVNRRTFAQVRREEHVTLARYIDKHADKLAANDQGEAATALRGLSSNIRAGFGEGEGRS